MRKSFFALPLLPVGCAFLLMLLSAGCGDGPVDLPSCEGVEWEYEGAYGPDEWSNLCVDFTACAGAEQSPIDISGAKDDASLQAIAEHFASTGTHIVNKGHTIQLNTDAGSSITVNGETYNLLQFHFHTHSEHLLNGAAYPMEMHFVHKNEATGKLAVIGVLVKEGAENHFLDPFLHHLPATKDAVYDDAATTYNVTDALPANRSYFTYGGSLTTPPCSQIVTWLVMENPVEATAAQIQELHELEHDNARPTQDLHGRSIRHFHI